MPGPVRLIVRGVPPSEIAPRVNDPKGLLTLKIGLPERAVAPIVKPAAPETVSVLPLIFNVPNVAVVLTFIVELDVTDTLFAE